MKISLIDLHQSRNWRGAADCGEYREALATKSGSGPPPLRSWRPEESHVESSEHQDNANIYYQPFPESVSEEREIYTDYNGDHRHRVKHFSCPSVHFITMTVDGVGGAD